MRTGFDAVYASNGPAPVDVACGYIGGDTPHVWRDDEWASRPERWRLPIWVRDFGGNPSADGAAAKAWAQAHGMPAGTVIALDFEQRVDGGYIFAFQVAVTPYLVLLYGAASYVFGNPRPNGGYWAAAWNGSATLYGGWSHQFQSTNNYDLSVFADSTPLWDTHGPAPDPPAPPKPKGKKVFLFELPNGSLYTSDLVFFRWLNGQDEVAAAEWLIASTGISASPNKVARWQEMGVPADAQSANAAGAPWPAAAN